MNDLNEKQLLETIRKFAQTVGVRAFSKACGVAPSTITRITQGKLRPSAKVLRYLGVERVVIYRKVKPKTAR